MSDRPNDRGRKSGRGGARNTGGASRGPARPRNASGPGARGPKRSTRPSDEGWGQDGEQRSRPRFADEGSGDRPQGRGAGKGGPRSEGPWRAESERGPRGGAPRKRATPRFDEDGGSERSARSAGPRKSAGPRSEGPWRAESDRGPRGAAPRKRATPRFDEDGGGERSARSSGPRKSAGPRSEGPWRAENERGPRSGAPRKRATSRFDEDGGGERPTRSAGPRKSAGPKGPGRWKDSGERRPTAKTYRSRVTKPNPDNEGKIRLNRYLAQAGVGSRREADDLITSGAVTVNGVIVTALGTQVLPTDVVHFGGQKLRTEQLRYVLLNKPKNTITTTDDPQERHTVMDLIAGAAEERLYPVGRLDRHTTGVLLLTNDGDLAKKLTHPSHGAEKLYHATLDKNMTAKDLAQLMEGVELEDGPASADEASYVEGATRREIGLRIHMGRNRVVRRMFEALGYEVVKLDRVFFAGLTKKDLSRGRWRHLSEKEVTLLKRIRPTVDPAGKAVKGRTRQRHGDE